MADAVEVADLSRDQQGGTLRPAYTTGADSYDARTAAFQQYRERIVDALALEPGQVVLDVGCGTGLCFSRLREGVGEEGAVVGIDESAEMASQARQRADASGWRNVSVLRCAAEQVEVTVTADRVLFCAVHDVLQSAAGLANIVSQVPPGTRVVAGGGKLASAWMGALNLQVMALHRPYVRSFEGFSRPWARLAEVLDDVEVTEFAFGTGYVAVGRVPAGAPSAG
jgi:SAM-dependent methyltransferase